ncbi:MAG: AAA family ATPase, partial [Candidatus Eremiobacteraeota bacterium]|nr:AAA family ATPase [Candidatus Eremiobacteraeota bacterium]
HEELAYLHERRLDASAGRGGVVLLAGEAGVGKSRLIAEFRSSLAKTRVRIAVGQCLEFAQRPYGPVLDVLARFDPESLDLVPAETKLEQFDAIVVRFARASERSPLIAIFEDVHWADVATLQLLAYLATKLEAMRLLVIASFRPEHVDDGDSESNSIALIADAPRASRITLKPLSGHELRLFIDEALVGIELAAETRRAVARTSEGNPFFVEELLKSAVEQTELPTRPGGARRLPESIRATMMARLRPLDENDRRVVAQAAVIGRRFDLALLCETLAADRSTVIAGLHRARDLQLLDEEPDDRFRFRHALTREAIYDNFLTAQVRPLHRKIALALEAVDEAHRSVEGLAYHWWAAGDRERGVHFTELAGDAAGAVFAHNDAIAWYERALGLIVDESPGRAVLLAKVGHHRTSLGSHVGAQAALTEAADILRNARDYDGEATYRIMAAQSAHLAGVPDAKAALEIMLERLPADAQRARSRLRLQLAWYEAGFRFRAAAAAGHLAELDEASVFADADLTRTYHTVSALVHCLTGDVAALRTESEKALSASLATPHADRTVWIRINTAMEFACLDLRAEAHAHFARARELAVARKTRNFEAHVHAMSASVLYIDGDLQGVRRAVEAATALRTDSTIVLGHCAAWGTLAGLALGDDRLIETWFDDRPEAMHREELDYFAAGYAEILTRRGRAGEARALLHDAILGGDVRRGIVCTLLAVARLGDERDFERARALLVAATNATVDVLERPALALFEAHIARRGSRHGSAVDHAREAAHGFREHHAPLLEATALEVAGDVPAAMAIYNKLGAAGDIRRVAGRFGMLVLPDAAMPGNSVLSNRESEIVLLAAQGLTNLEIAQRLSISHKTVEKHLGAVYAKLGLSSRAQLATWVSQAGMGRA